MSSYETEIRDLVEKAASRLNEGNDVEHCWVLRGVLDGIMGDGPEYSAEHDEDYGTYYRRGYHVGNVI